MPRIIIHTSGPDGAHGRFTLSERVTVADLESEHYAGQLLERIAWAISDAEAIEASTTAADSNQSSAAHGRAGQEPLPQSPEVAGGISAAFSAPRAGSRRRRARGQIIDELPRERLLGD